MENLKIYFQITFTFLKYTIRHDSLISLKEKYAAESRSVQLIISEYLLSISVDRELFRTPLFDIF